MSTQHRAVRTLTACLSMWSTAIASHSAGDGARIPSETDIPITMVDLANVQWSLYGWRPFSWKLSRSMETGQYLQADIGPFPAKVPGSVQEALREAGVLPDWNTGVNSRDCEWVEHYHWQFHAEIPDGKLSPTRPVMLDAQGLDYSGWVYLDGNEVGRFQGTFTPHRFDLTPHMSERPVHSLDIVFEEPPREQGQIGFTSRSQYFKPRFAYGWDWCPRLVPIGVWDRLTLRFGLNATVEVRDWTARLDSDNQTGHVGVSIEANMSGVHALRVQAHLCEGERVLTAVESPLESGINRLSLHYEGIQPWWPNGTSGNPDGHAHTYRLAVRVIDEDGRVQWQDERTVGFKRIDWSPCQRAPSDALPWVCVVNGEPLFLQGVNWSPVRALYPDTRDEEYAQLIDLYRQMGCNCFRVNGVGLLEKRVFYELCDAAGILVWQDFPLSSSGIDNWPPEDPKAITDLAGIAESFIQRRRGHPSLLLWCGGNELQGGMQGEKIGGGKPVTVDHPCLAALQQVVEQCDPGRRFLPTTAFGPVFYAHRDEFGKGMHHLVHGPWGMSTFSGLDDWRDYWAHDDSLFRAEVGMPGASPPDLIRKYVGGLPTTPEAMAVWKHGCAWWIQWDRFKVLFEGLSEEAALARYCEATRQEQADALAIAARACKERFPSCGGFLVWHGHDCFPCAINNSLIDFERNPKPAYYALQGVFRTPEPP